jgi:hypothetical protein
MRLSSQLGCGAFALLLLASGCDAQSCSSVQVPITSCTASSAFSDLGCQNAYDGNTATEWANVAQGTGAFINLNFAGSQTLGGFQYVNRAPRFNAGVKKVRLTFSDGTFADFDNLNNNAPTPNSYVLGSPKATTSVRITALETYPGASYVGASEIKFMSYCPAPPAPPAPPSPAPPYACPPGPCAAWCHNYNSNDARCSGCYHNVYCTGVNSRCDSWCSAWTCSSKSPMLGHIPFFAEHCDGCSFCKTEEVAKKVTASYG